MSLGPAVNSPARQGERGEGGWGKEERKSGGGRDKGELLTRITLLQEKGREGSGR